MNQADIGKKIAFFRKKSNMTQEHLGEKLNISGKTVSKWERGIALPDIITLKKICEVLKIELDDIITSKTDSVNSEDLNKKSQHKSYKNLKICLLFTGIIFCFIILNYNNYFQIFNIVTEDEQFLVNGYMILSNKRNVLILNNIKNLDKINGDYDKIKIVSIEVIVENCNKKIFSYSNLDIENVSFDDNLNEMAIYIDNFKYNYLLHGTINKMNFIIEFIDENNKKNMIDITLLAKK